MKTSLSGAEVFYADEQTDRQERGCWQCFMEFCTNAPNIAMV